jgi:uncharacterized protein (TIGR02646 family)
MIRCDNQPLLAAAAETAWKKDAEKVVTDIMAAFHAAEPGRRPKLNFNRAGAVYEKLRTVLREVFNNKCAYCEKALGSDSGEIEHYRPKAEVTGAPDHPGYYWLVVQPNNLFISCSRCNSKKRNKFPVRGTRSNDPAMTPEQLDISENPLLLNPYRHDSADHLRFTHGSGKVIGVSPEGSETIKALKLDDEELEKERRQAQEDAWDKLFARYHDKPDEFRKTLREIFAGNYQFSAPVIVHVTERFRERGLIHDMKPPFAYRFDPAPLHVPV